MPLQILHFTAPKSLSRACSPYVCVHQPARAAVTPAQRQGCEPEPPEPAKFCQATCHMLQEPSCEHSCNPAYCPCHQTKEAFKLEGLYAFCILFQFVFCCCHFGLFSHQVILAFWQKGKQICQPKGCLQRVNKSFFWHCISFMFAITSRNFLNWAVVRICVQIITTTQKSEYFCIN